MVKANYEVKWIESERGWGQKYSHSTYHKSLEKAEKAIKKYWDKEKKDNPNWVVPDYYIYPETPKLVEVK